MRVLCTRPGAGERISGVRFARTADGMLSDEIAPEVAAALFLSVPGYSAVLDPEPEAQPEPKRRGRPPKEREDAGVE